MTMITFGRSVTFNDDRKGQRHDATWVKSIPKISRSNTFCSGLSQVGESQGHIISDAVNVTAISPAYYSIGELDLIHLWS